MNQVQQELATAIKTNFAMLGLNIDDPSITCNCSITPGGNKPSAPVIITTATTTPDVVSQFVAGGSTLSTDSLALNAVDPGNAPFIFPAGTTPDSIVSDQQTAAQAALEVAQAAAAKAAATLATTATVTVTSSASGGPATTVSATSSADNTTTSTSTATPDLVSSGSPVTALTPASLLESFTPRNERRGGGGHPTMERRLHTLQLDLTRTRRQSGGGGWGICGQLSGLQLTFFVVGIIIAWYVMKVSHGYATGQQ